MTNCTMDNNNESETIYCDWLFSQDLTLNKDKYYAICCDLELNLIYLNWLFGLFWPLLTFVLFLFLLPFILISFVYACSIFLYLKKHWFQLQNAFRNQDLWNSTFKSLALFWEMQGFIWHGHEIVGFDNIPDSGPALMIFYHAALPIDFYYLFSKTLLYKNRQFKIVADRFVFKVPGLKTLTEVLDVTPGTVENCADVLKKGHLLAISPGGVREALFGDHNYELIWADRKGFAKAAIKAKVPVIPMFTKNSREAIRSLGLFRRFFRWVYEKTRLPLVPIYGIFPVKLITYIGKPIEHDDNRTVDELVTQTKNEIEDLIRKHQKTPGNIFRALIERFI